MEIREENIETFDAYLRGKMSEEEQRLFQDRLEHDVDWASQFEEYRSLVSGMQAHFKDELKRELQAIDSEMDRNKGSSKGTNPKQLAWVSGGIAASLLIALFAYGVFGKTNTLKLAKQHWPAEQGLPVKMSAKGKYDNAMNAFKMEEWERAEKRLLIFPASDTSAYFLGNVYFKQGHYAEAAAQFEKIPSASAWHDEALLRLALVYLAQEKAVEAQSLLQEVAASDSPFRADATAVLEDL